MCYSSSDCLNIWDTYIHAKSNSKVEANYLKGQVVDVKTGDTVRVHQKIKEGNKERTDF